MSRHESERDAGAVGEHEGIQGARGAEGGSDDVGLREGSEEVTRLRRILEGEDREID